MSEVINLLSSDEEESAPPKKRVKPIRLDEDDVQITSIKPKSLKQNSSDIVILSDEEESNFTVDDDNDSVTFIEEHNGSDKKLTEHSTNQENSNTNGNVSKTDKVTIDENSSEESSGKENKYNSKQTVAPSNSLSIPSTSKIPQDRVLENFLTICEASINTSPYEHLKDKQFPVIRKYYKKIGSKLTESSNFLKLVEENEQRARKSPAAAVISFNEVFQYIKGLVDAESIEVSEDNRIKLKKLERTIKLLISRIKLLENSELDFEDEEDSTYLQLDRYINRLNKVYEKYCELLKKNPHSGRITYEKLDFVDSEYNEINRAISKKYKNNKKFPSYLEMEAFIKNIVEEHSLDLSEAKIKTESVRCFKKLGELLQNRRKKELYDAHYSYIRDSEDPAKTNASLDTTLKQNFAESQVKIEKICEEFVTKEECGEEVELSEEDSDKSNYVDSENENKDQDPCTS